MRRDGGLLPSRDGIRHTRGSRLFRGNLILGLGVPPPLQNMRFVNLGLAGLAFSAVGRREARQGGLRHLSMRFPGTGV